MDHATELWCQMVESRLARIDYRLQQIEAFMAALERMVGDGPRIENGTLIAEGDVPLTGDDDAAAWAALYDPGMPDHG
jgi:hypothetical protein